MADAEEAGFLSFGGFDEDETKEAARPKESEIISDSDIATCVRVRFPAFLA
jgi:hypothetical protein